MYMLTEDPSKIAMPSLVGKSMKEALRVCTLLRTPVQIQGSGYVKEQVWVTVNQQKTLKLILGPLGSIFPATPTPQPQTTVAPKPVGQ
jgi:penicillin-binding protein 2B